MTTRRRSEKIESPVRVTITVGGTEYKFLAAPEVQRYQTNDRPPAYRTSQGGGFQGQYFDSLVVGGITDCYAGRAIGPWSRPSISEALAQGFVRVLHDCEGETRFGFRGPPRQQNTLTFPTLVNINADNHSIFGGAVSSGTAISRQSFHDRPGVYYAGSAVSGFHAWEAIGEADAGSNAQIADFAWTGAAFSAQVSVDQAAANTDEVRGFDMVVHKGILLFVFTSKRGTAASNQIYFSITGNTWADAGTQPVAEAFLEGTRFVDDDNNLWLIMQTASNIIRITKSTDMTSAGTSTWAATTIAGQGQIRSVGKYYNRDQTPVIVVLTEDGLYEIDEINNKLVLLWQLPARGRGMIAFGGSLFVCMDAMQVTRYTQREGEQLIEDVSPGGGEAMPSGKDFREDTDGQVVLTVSARGIYAAWSGDGPTSGTLNRALCLFYSGHTLGWHFIWRAANTTGDVGYSARALALDPVSGDLLYFGATVTAGDEARTHDSVRIIKAETDPRLLTANVYETSGYDETPLITLPPTSVPTTFFSKFYNSENLADASTDISIQTQFGVDGAAATTSTLDTNAVLVDLARSYFPSDATAATTAAGTDAAGSSFNTIRVRTNYAGSATVGAVLYNDEYAYAKVPDVKDIFMVDIIVDPALTDMTIPNADQVFTNLDTVRDAKTKVTLNYSLAAGNFTVLPVAEARLRERIQEAEVLPARREGTMRLVLAEI